jgi:hypothetical protein
MRVIQTLDGVVVVSAIEAVELIKPRDPDNFQKVVIYAGGRTYRFAVCANAEQDYQDVLSLLNVNIING